MQIFSHRGRGAGFPENTEPAFQSAINAEVDGIETDIQLTKDGKVVIHHDERLGRVFQGNEKLFELTLEELQSRPCLVEGQEEVQIPTLESVLKLFKANQRLINIEIKVYSAKTYKALVEKTQALVQELEMLPFVFYSSFYRPALEYMKSLDPEAACLLLLEDEDAGDILLLPQLNGFHLSIDTWRKLPENVKKQLMKVTVIRLWTVNQPEDIKLAWKDGIAALISDVPETVKTLVQEFY